MSKRKRRVGGDAPPKSKSQSRSEDNPAIRSVKDDTNTVVPLRPDLERLLHPITRDEFLRDCFRKCAVHVQGKDFGVIREAMFGLDADQILRETSSDSVFVWLQERMTEGDDNNNNNNMDDDPKRLIQSVEIENVETAISLHKIGGHATYCRAPPRVEQCLVSSLLKSTGLGCGQYDPSGESMISMGRGEVEVFISTPGHLTNWHYDFQENFTIQLSGTKRWTIQRGSVSDPIRGCTPHYASPSTVESQLKAAHLMDRKFRFGLPQDGVNAVGDRVVAEVKPGDVLYFPAGMWHKVETLEPGVSINVSLMASNYATVACQALQHYLLHDDTWRQPVINNGVESATDQLQALIDDLASKISQLNVNNRAANSIIPPILRYPPNFELGDDEDDEDDGWNDLQSNGSEEEEDRRSVGDDGNGMEDDTSKSEEVDLFDMDEDVRHPESFQSYPEEWKEWFDDRIKSGWTRITKNPLSVLYRSDEIRNYYYEKSSVKDVNHLFVMNNNYAGNEMHQSAVRVVFSDINQIAQILVDIERRGGVIDMAIDESNSDMIRFLVFHGYLELLKVN